jgi:hypothetical protein
VITLTEPQSKLVPLLEQRLTPQEIIGRLDWSRQYLSVVMQSLTKTGLLRSEGELPPKARASTSPTSEELDLWETVVDQEGRIGCDEAKVSRVRRNLTRVGMHRPDDRPKWSGHTIRRIEWSHNGGRWVVQGLLVPRSDGRHWSNATPDYRIVTVSWDDGRPEYWLDGRGLVVPIGSVGNVFAELPTDELIGLTMAVAWVMESRALLDPDALSSSILDGAE